MGAENAEDIVARAFVRLAERLEQEPGKNVGDLLGLVVNGLEIDYYRRQAARRAVEVPVGLRDDLDAVAAGQHLLPPLTVDAYEFQQDFDRAVRDLDDEERDAFILTELRGLSERAAADVLDISQPTVHRRAEAARTNVRKELVAR